MTKTRVAFLSLAAAMATVPAGPVGATPGSGVLASEIVAIGRFIDQVDLKFKVTGGDPKVIQANNAQDTVIQHVVLAPGGITGWHSHPGPAVAVITAGELTLYSGDDPTCTGRRYLQGETLIDSGQGHVHIARNEGVTNVDLWVTYFDVPSGGAIRIDAPDPQNCNF